MVKPLLTLKPSIINALLPTFLRNLFYSAIFVSILFGLSVLIEKLNIMNFSESKIFWLILILVVLPIISLLVKMTLLLNTTYYFFRTYVSREFELIIIKKHSVPYSQITNVSTDISIWDRFCNAGDITLYTAEDVGPDFVLRFIKDPVKLEQSIYKIKNVTPKSNP